MPYRLNAESLVVHDTNKIASGPREKGNFGVCEIAICYWIVTEERGVFDESRGRGVVAVYETLCLNMEMKTSYSLDSFNTHIQQL